MTVITSIEDLRVLAKKRVPRMFYDYADSGSWTEGTYRANESDFQKIKLRQRVAVDMSNRRVATTMIGIPTAMPVAIAPTGLTGMQHADGEILAARAAERFGIPFTLSMMSICSIEDVAAHTKAPFWFQPYMLKDRPFMQRLFERARAARCSALVLTLDLQILGQRHKDIKNGLTRAAQADARQHPQPDDQAALVPRHARNEAALVRQHRRPRRERLRSGVAVRLDRDAVRPDAELGRRRVGQAPVGAAS